MELVRLTTGRAHRALLKAALEIYSASLPGHVLNAEEDIIDNIENYERRHGDAFFAIAFKEGGKVVGYAEFIHFKKDDWIFFDYICVPPQHYGLSHSLPLMRKLMRYISSQTLNETPRIVFEVARKDVGKSIWAKDESRIRFFQYLGFKLIDAKFSYPDLMRRPMAYPADIMVYDKSIGDVATPDYLVALGRVIYFQNYLRWDKNFLPKERWAEREAFITQLYAAFVAGIAEGEPVKAYERRATLGSAIDVTLRYSLVQILLPLITNPRIWAFCVVCIFLAGTSRAFHIDPLSMIGVGLLSAIVSVWLFDPERGEKLISIMARRRFIFAQL